MRGLFVISVLSLATICRAEPQLTSMFPFGGQRGTSFDLNIRGSDFEDVHDVLFSCDHLQGTAMLHPAEEDEPAVLVMTVHADANAALGWHCFHLVASHGVSRPWSIFITDVPIDMEGEQSSSAAHEAKQIDVPIAVFGTISTPGEADYYTIDVGQDDALALEVVTPSGVFLHDSIPDGPRLFPDPELSLLQTGESWFDPERPTPVDYTDHSLTYIQRGERITGHRLARLTHHFSKAGSYLVRVTEKMGYGGADYVYLLKIHHVHEQNPVGQVAWTPRELADPDPHEWHEHDFSRPLGVDHTRKIWTRTGQTPEVGDEVCEIASVSEDELSDQASQSLPISLPTLIRGAIDEAGDVDAFRFHVEPGETLAMEIETPRLFQPHFNPRMIVSDEDGKELFNNTYRKVAGDGDDWVKSIEPKVVYTFEKGGDYDLRVRDFTSRYGGPDFVYHLLVRKQVPHIGNVKVNTTHVNLSPGGSESLTVTLSREEGFVDDVAIDVLNLPEGTRVLPAHSVPPAKGPPNPALHQERFVATSNDISVRLVALQNATPMEMPRMAQVVVRPIGKENLCAPVVVKELPVMIVKQQAKEPESDSENPNCGNPNLGPGRAKPLLDELLE